MDLCLAKSFIASFLLVVCLKYLHTEEMNTPSRRKVTEQKPKERNHKASYHSENEDICSCNGNVCYYCENGLYCNNQRNACCPDINSNSNCGGFCVPPGYTCCYDKKGVCLSEKPVCCDEHCCKENSECCGKGCCSEETKCCKNRENKNFCIAKAKISEDYCKNDDCVKHVFKVTNDIFEYFENICTTFKEGTRKTNPKNTEKTKITQFAVLTLNKASDNNANNNEYVPNPPVFELDQQQVNYASASPKPPEHAENRILQNLETMLKNFSILKPESIPFPPNIYLLTFLSPCDSCVKDIVHYMKSVNEAKVGTKYIGWHLTYNRIEQAKFLEGIETLIKEKITIVYKINGICPNEKHTLLFQPELLEILTHRYKHEDIYNCDKLALKSSFIMLINLLVWKCKDDFKLHDNKETSDKIKNKVINCMIDEIGKLEPKINPCMDLPDIINDAISIIFKNNINLLLSPPLDPYSETVSISNDIDDLHGTYDKTYFCFQVFNESPDN